MRCLQLSPWAKVCAEGYLDASRIHSLIFSAAPAPARDWLTRSILIDDLADLLTVGNDDNAWLLESPAFAAVFLFNALHGAVTQASGADNCSERETLLRNIVKHFQRVVS